MLQKTWPDIVTVGCIVVVALFEALEQAISQSPHIASLLPHASGVWHYIPLALLVLAGLSWFVGHFREKLSPPKSASLPNAFRHPRWEIINNHRYENEAVDVDGRSFHDCSFKNATLAFHGNAPTEFKGNSYFENVVLSTDHPPTMFWRTLEYLFSAIPGAKLDTSLVDASGHKVERKLTAFPIASDDELQLSLEAAEGEIHSYDPTGKPYFFVRSCCPRFLRNIRFDPIESLGGHRIWLDEIASLSPGQRVPVGFHAGQEGEYRGVVNHLINFFEGGSTASNQPQYPITARYLDGNRERTEQHSIQGQRLPKGGIRLRIAPTIK